MGANKGPTLIHCRLASAQRNPRKQTTNRVKEDVVGSDSDRRSRALRHRHCSLPRCAASGFAISSPSVFLSVH